MSENLSFIISGVSQFILGVGSCFGVCVFLGGVILKRHEERHSTQESGLDDSRAKCADLNNRLVVVETVCKERGATCKIKTKRRKCAKE